jgi:hypothetical protein
MMKWVWRLIKARLVLWVTGRIRRALTGAPRRPARR